MNVGGGNLAVKTELKRDVDGGVVDMLWVSAPNTHTALTSGAPGVTNVTTAVTLIFT